LAAESDVPLVRATVAALLAALLVPGGAGATTAADLCAPAAPACVVTQSREVDPGSILDFGSRPLTVRAGASLDVGPGTMTIMAASLTLEPGAALLARGRGTSERGGLVSVTTTGDIRLAASGQTRARIDLSARDAGGRLRLRAGGSIDLQGDLAAQATTAGGVGGGLDIDALGSVILAAGAQLKASGGGAARGGSVTVAGTEGVLLAGPIDASGGDGGIITLITDESITTSPAARLDARATGAFNDGGDLVMVAGGSVSIAGPLLGRGSGSTTEGGGTGGALDVVAGGSLVIEPTAALDFSGTPPDGEGGEVDLTAALDLTLAGSLVAAGMGEEGTGGSVALAAGRDLTLGALRVTGGGLGGGELIASAAELATVGGEIDADGTGEGGSVEVDAERLVVRGTVHASGLAGRPGGKILLGGCDLEVEAAGRLTTAGRGGENLLAAAGRLVLAAGSTLIAGGANRFEHRDPELPPAIHPAARVQPSPRVSANPLLPPCARDLLCGNGQTDPGEECDDGNLSGCDGCSPRCRLEACGTGRVDCGEECDDGNAASGDGCDANCTRTRCGNGVATAPEECDAGDTVACDGCSATCRVERCGNGVVECGEGCDDGPGNGAPGGRCDAECRRVPGAECGDGGAGPGEQCDDGNRTACDGCSPTCAREGCGSGTVECAEECDDFNTEACDGCSPSCHVEACGNGTADCREECDDGDAASGDGCDVNCTRTRCGNGVVTAGEQCDDGNTFDDDGCDSSCRRRVPCPGDPRLFCQVCEADTECDPAGRCAGRACVAGACVAVPPVDCDDGRAGNVDTCVLDGAGTPRCRHTCFGPAACDDGNACNGAERCAAGACAAGPALDCDDRDLCTDDRCDPSRGCAHDGRTGFALTTCSLETIEAAVAAAPGDLTPGLRRAVLKLTAAARDRLTGAAEAAAAGRTKREARMLRRAGGRLAKLEGLIERARRRDKITDALAAVVRAQGTSRAAAAVVSLLEALGR
jgi:cysteine-rich repeat protein